MLRTLRLLRDVAFQPLAPAQPPLHVQLESTTACNLECRICPRWRVIDVPARMTFDSFKRIYDQIAPLRINLSGLGEPFTNRDVFRMATYASARGTAVNLPTNFTLAGKCLDDILQSGISQLKVSLDAATRETYLETRGCDEFDEIITAIETLNSMKAAAKVTRPEIRFNFAVQSGNVGELVDIVELASRLEVSTVYFQHLEFTGMEDSKPALVGDLDFATLSKNLNAASRTARSRNVRTNLAVWLRDLDAYVDRMRPGGDCRPNRRTCFFPWFSTYVQVNGDVKPCPHFMFTPAEGCMGNVLREPFESIWRGPAYRELRRALRARRRPYAPCESCVPERLSSLVHVHTRLLPRLGQRSGARR